MWIGREKTSRDPYIFALLLLAISHITTFTFSYNYLINIKFIIILALLSTMFALYLYLILRIFLLDFILLILVIFNIFIRYINIQLSILMNIIIILLLVALIKDELYEKIFLLSILGFAASLLFNTSLSMYIALVTPVEAGVVLSTSYFVRALFYLMIAGFTAPSPFLDLLSIIGGTLLFYLYFKIRNNSYLLYIYFIFKLIIIIVLRVRIIE